MSVGLRHLYLYYIYVYIYIKEIYLKMIQGEVSLRGEIIQEREI